jgi:hypothetical protein
MQESGDDGEQGSSHADEKKDLVHRTNHLVFIISSENFQKNVYQQNANRQMNQ